MMQYTDRTSPAFSRRRLLQGSAGLVPLLLCPSMVRGQEAKGGRRFVQIFLNGGWDTALATDPPDQAKLSTGTWAPFYRNLPVTRVPGKDGLRLGAGLAPAAPAFARMNTAFINGMFVEVTAHESAQRYLFSGRFSLSRTREYPALAALVAAQTGHFPAHVVLGGAVPLGGTRESAPPLHAITGNLLNLLVAGPRGNNFKFADTAIDQMNGLVNSLDEMRRSGLKREAAAANRTWRAASSRVGEIYDGGYDSLLQLDDTIRARYGYQQDGDVAALLASAWLTLKSGMTPFVTVHTGGFDTHANHPATHGPLQQAFARALKIFVDDLHATPDPDQPGLSLAETTTLLITSEFSRTPGFNDNGGTDHWKSASAILMGAGIRDGRVSGATGMDAMPLGWQDGGAVPFRPETEFNAGHVFASLVRHLGYGPAAATISPVHLQELFHG